jgi:hypothetical protein
MSSYSYQPNSKFIFFSCVVLWESTGLLKYCHPRLSRILPIYVYLCPRRGGEGGESEVWAVINIFLMSFAENKYPTVLHIIIVTPVATILLQEQPADRHPEPGHDSVPTICPLQPGAQIQVRWGVLNVVCGSGISIFMYKNLLKNTWHFNRGYKEQSSRGCLGHKRDKFSDLFLL